LNYTFPENDKLEIVGPDDDFKSWKMSYPKRRCVSFQCYQHQMALSYVVDKYTKGNDYIIVIDSDSIPIEKGWNLVVIDYLKRGFRLVGALRQHRMGFLQVHPSILAITAQDYKQNGLDFFGVGKIIKINNRKIGRDTAVKLTRWVLNNHHSIKYLKRSNRSWDKIDKMFFGVYGDIIYHHGCGSRDNYDKSKFHPVTYEIDAKIKKYLVENQMQKFIEYIRK